MDRENLLERIVAFLKAHQVCYCVIGGQAVNAYVEPVVSLEDVLQGKIWAVQDPDRRASKRQKDLADVARLLEGYPKLREQAPDDVLVRLV